MCYPKQYQNKNVVHLNCQRNVEQERKQGSVRPSVRPSVLPWAKISQ